MGQFRTNWASRQYVRYKLKQQPLIIQPTKLKVSV
jgi:hypothetical protein